VRVDLTKFVVIAGYFNNFISQRLRVMDFLEKA